MIVDINNTTPALDALREQDDAYDAGHEQRQEDAMYDLRDDCAKGIEATEYNIHGQEYESVYAELFGYTCHELKAANTFDRAGLSPDALQRIGLLVARKVCQQLADYAKEAA